MITLSTLTAAQIRRYADIKEQIENLEVELAAIAGNATPTVEVVRKRRGMSAAGRARIAAAQRARWAKLKGTNHEEAPKRRKKMSAAGRAKIAAAARARWAKAKAAGKNAL